MVGTFSQKIEQLPINFQ